MDSPLGTWRVVDEPSPPAGGYDQLAPVARELGLGYRGAPRLKFTLNGAEVTLSLDIDSGSVVGLTALVALEIPPGVVSGPSVELRLEKAADRDGKARGINREVQTGDARFDEQVYVDADTTDAEVLRLLASQQARDAVVSLIAAGARSVKLTLTHAAATWKKGEPPNLFEPAHLLPALRDLLAVTRAGGPVGWGARARGRWLLPAAGLLATALLPFVFVALDSWCPEDRTLPLVGVASGPVLAIALRPLLARYFAGHSSSFARYRAAAVMLAVALALLGCSVPVTLNAVLAQGRPAVRHGVVTRVGAYDSESNTTTTTVKWDDGQTTDHDFAPEVRLGDAVTTRRFPGAFGYSWLGRVRLGSQP